MYSRANETGRPRDTVNPAGDGLFTGAGIRRGLLLSQPLTPGVLLYAMVFGVLASERGLSWLQAAAMSVFVYSGSAQLAVLQAWSQSSLIAPLVATVTGRSPPGNTRPATATPASFSAPAWRCSRRGWAAS